MVPILTHLLNINSAQIRTPGISASQAKKEMDRELSQPFCYYSHPTDQIGFEGSPKATIVTYDGSFVTAYGQLSFYSGQDNRLVPVHKRVKTFYDNFIPVIEFDETHGSLQYHFEAFCTPPNLNPTGDPITFIRVRVYNPTNEAVKGLLGVNYGPNVSKVNEDPDFPGFLDQRKTLDDTLDAQRSTTWNTDPFMDRTQFAQQPVQDKIGEHGIVVNDHLACFAPQGESGMPDYENAYKGTCEEYTTMLKPHQSKAYTFKLLDIPIQTSRTANIVMASSCGYEQYRQKTINYWRSTIDSATHFSVNDPKVMNTYKTSLVNDLISTEVNNDGHLYQRVNKLQYNYMWIRDSSYFIRNYCLIGRFDLAKDLLQDFLVWKNNKPIAFFAPDQPQPDGARLSVQDDYWGQVLWAFGAYERTTHDMKLLKQIYPLLQPHIDLFVKKVAADPKGLWPVAGPYDNEGINGHYTGHSFWCLLGLRNAVDMAKMMGRSQDASQWQEIHDKYKANFMKHLRTLVKGSDGYIPPGMDDVNAGNDWANAGGGLFPFGVLSKNDPIARETLAMVRQYNYKEGIMTYGGNAWVAKQTYAKGQIPHTGLLHDYETFFVTEGNTVLEKQEKVVKDLYSILVHTGSTNGGFEFSIEPWGNRDPGGNFPPHGWFAARYMQQIRDCLVREDDYAPIIHLASVLAPDWVEPGNRVIAKDAPTFYGTVGFDMACRTNGATVSLHHNWRPGQAPSEMVFHFPWFLKVESVKVDGRTVRVSNQEVVLPSDAKEMPVTWKWLSHPNLSYKEGVKLYLEKYWMRPKGMDERYLFPESGNN